MKKFICLLLALILLVSMVACDTPENIEEDTTNAGQTNAPASENLKESAEKYEGVFKVGFARVDITPSQLPHPRKDGTLISDVLDPIYATCIAVNDGENTALLYTVDLPNIAADTYAAYRLRLKIMTKVPIENIMISATHNHSSFTPQAPRGNAQADKWNTELINHLINAANEAMADLADAEIYYGTAKTTGMAWVRRSLHEDGTYSNKGTVAGLKSTTPIVGPASEADDTLQLIRYVRKDKKDVVMTNWQCHLASAVDAMPKKLTADLAFYVRDAVEGKEDDVYVAYFAGASGNIGTAAPNAELRQYRNYQEMGKALGKLVYSTMDVSNLTKLEAGKIQGDTTTYKALVWKDSDERKAQAAEVLALAEGSKEQQALMVKYNFNTLYAARQVASRNGSVTHRDQLLGAISFGDLAFVSAPYEMFDTNGMQIKDGSPYKSTFVLTCSGGAQGYVPSYEAYTIYGGYEVDNTEIACGEAEKMVAEFLRMLNSFRGIQ